MKQIFAAVAITAAVAALPGLAVAQQGSGAVDRTTQGRTVEDIVLDQAERRIIRDFFKDRAAGAAGEEAEDADEAKDAKGRKRGGPPGRGGPSGRGGPPDRVEAMDLPPGLAKRDMLPPGLAMQLERGGTLPPGLAKRNLPADLEDRLPPAGEGRKRVIIDDDVVLIEETTEMVLDILRDVVPSQ